MSIPFQILFPCYDTVLSRLLCAIWQVLVTHLFLCPRVYTSIPSWKCIPPAPCFPLGNHEFGFKIFESVSFLQILLYYFWVSFCIIFSLDSIYMWDSLYWSQMIFVFLWLSMLISRSMLLQMPLFHSFWWPSSIPFHICTLSSLSSSLLMDI